MRPLLAEDTAVEIPSCDLTAELCSPTPSPAFAAPRSSVSQAAPQPAPRPNIDLRVSKIESDVTELKSDVQQTLAILKSMAAGKKSAAAAKPQQPKKPKRSRLKYAYLPADQFNKFRGWLSAEAGMRQGTARAIGIVIVRIYNALNSRVGTGDSLWGPMPSLEELQEFVSSEKRALLHAYRLGIVLNRLSGVAPISASALSVCHFLLSRSGLRASPFLLQILDCDLSQPVTGAALVSDYVWQEFYKLLAKTPRRIVETTGRIASTPVTGQLVNFNITKAILHLAIATQQKAVFSMEESLKTPFPKFPLWETTPV